MFNKLRTLCHSPYGKLRAAGIPRPLRLGGKQLFFWLNGFRAKPNGELTQFGATGAQWCIRDELLGEAPFLVSAGLSDDVRFELEFLATHPNATLLGIDPTPLCSAVMQDLAEQFRDRVEYRAVALGGTDSSQTIHAELNSCGEAVYYYWTLPPYCSGRKLEQRTLEVVGIQTLLAGLESPSIDLLKIDIEGAEYELLETLLSSPILPRQLLVEFHFRFESFSLRQTKSLVNRLEGIGYRLEWMSDWREEFLFVHYSEKQ